MNLRGILRDIWSDLRGTPNPTLELELFGYIQRPEETLRKGGIYWIDRKKLEQVVTQPGDRIEDINKISEIIHESTNPDGYVTIELNPPVIFGPDGRPLLGPDGKPISVDKFFSGSGKVAFGALINAIGVLAQLYLDKSRPQKTDEILSGISQAAQSFHHGTYQEYRQVLKSFVDPTDLDICYTLGRAPSQITSLASTILTAIELLRRRRERKRNGNVTENEGINRALNGLQTAGYIFNVLAGFLSAYMVRRTERKLKENFLKLYLDEISNQDPLVLAGLVIREKAGLINPTNIETYRAHAKIVAQRIGEEEENQAALERSRILIGSYFQPGKLYRYNGPDDPQHGLFNGGFYIGLDSQNLKDVPPRILDKLGLKEGRTYALFIGREGEEMVEDPVIADPDQNSIGNWDELCQINSMYTALAVDRLISRLYNKGIRTPIGDRLRVYIRNKLIRW
ncbi:MAG: hypothetical protein QXY45_03395 [Candidatus Aenigmatarchaeota archaeon]